MTAVGSWSPLTFAEMHGPRWGVVGLGRLGSDPGAPALTAVDVWDPESG